MIPQSYIRSLVQGTTALLVINALLCLIGTALCAAMLYAIAINPQWPFLIIALISLIIADLARTMTIHQLRNRRHWKSYLNTTDR
jgi:hypothetical protein